MTIPNFHTDYNAASLHRLASLDCPIPFTKALEDQYLPKGRFEKELKAILQY